MSRISFVSCGSLIDAEIENPCVGGSIPPRATK
jgi:hypothetical protein